MPRRCAFGCNNTESTTMHRFPNPNKFPERFQAWVHLTGEKLETPSDYELFRKKRVCDIHFAYHHRNRFNRLNAQAIPTLNLPGGSRSSQQSGLATNTCERQPKASTDVCLATKTVVPLHCFPNPATEPERYKQWVVNCGADFQGKDKSFIFGNRRICRLHFDKKYHYPKNKISKLAVPILFGPLHKFPTCEYPHTERYMKWKEVLDPNTQARGYGYIRYSIRLCHRHFEKCYKSDHSYVLTRNAVPTINLDHNNVESSENIASRTEDAPSQDASSNPVIVLSKGVIKLSTNEAPSISQDSSTESKPVYNKVESSRDIAPRKDDASSKVVATSKDAGSSKDIVLSEVRATISTNEAPSISQELSTESKPGSWRYSRHISNPTHQLLTHQNKPDSAVDYTLLDDINIRMQYVYSLDYDEDLFGVKADTTSCKDARRKTTKRLVKLKSIAPLYLSKDDNSYDVEILDDQILFDDECEKPISKKRVIFHEDSYDEIASKERIWADDENKNAGSDKPILFNNKYYKNTRKKQGTTKKLVKLKAIGPSYLNNDDNDYEAVALDDFDDEYDKANSETHTQSPQTNQFSWQQEGVEVQDADLISDLVPQLPAGDPNKCDIEVKREKLREEILGIKREVAEPSPSPLKLGLMLDEENDLHQGYKCNICSSDIKGFRYVCVQCADFDLCGACEARRAHDRHYVLRIPGPRPHSEIQATLQVIRRTLMDAIVHVVNSEPIEVKDEEDCFEDPIGLQPAAARPPSPSDHDSESDDDASSLHDEETDPDHTPPKTPREIKAYSATKVVKRKVQVDDIVDLTVPAKIPRIVRSYPAPKNAKNSDQNEGECDQNIAENDQNIAESDQDVAISNQNNIFDANNTQEVPVVKVAEKFEKSVNTSQKECSALQKPILIKKVVRIGQPLASSLTSLPRVLDVSALPAEVRNQLVFHKQPSKIVHMKKARVAVERLSEKEILAATTRAYRPAGARATSTYTLVGDDYGDIDLLELS